MYFSDVWNNVPAGSTFTVSLKDDVGCPVTGTRTVTKSDGSVLTGAVASFPLKITVLDDERHKVKFDVLFSGAPAKIEIEAKVVRPDGTTFGAASPFTGQLSENAKVLTVNLFANG